MPIASATPNHAITLPWIEIVAGVLLVIGLWARAAAFMCVGMNVVFIIAIISALRRGLDISCGCFGGGAEAAGFSRHRPGLLFALVADFAASRGLPLAVRIHPGQGSGETATRNTGDKYSCFGVHLSDLAVLLERDAATDPA